MRTRPSACPIVRGRKRAANPAVVAATAPTFMIGSGFREGRISRAGVVRTAGGDAAGAIAIAPGGGGNVALGAIAVRPGGEGNAAPGAIAVAPGVCSKP